MSERTCLAIVLAAGEGIRMRSNLPKSLHSVGHRTLLAHVLASAEQAGCTDIAVVIGPDHAAVAAEARAVAPHAQTFEQRERLGTAHAVLAARKAIMRGVDDIVVMFADTPLVRPESLSRLRAPLAADAAVAVLGFVVGLTDLGPITIGANGEDSASIVADNDIGEVVFAPDPLPEARP